MNRIKDIHIALLENNIDYVLKNKDLIKSVTRDIINKDIKQMDSLTNETMSRIIDIANIIYNETSLDSIIDDDEYDILVERYKIIFNEYPIGKTEKILTSNEASQNSFGKSEPIKLLNTFHRKDYLYVDAIMPIDEKLFRRHPKVDMNIDHILNRSTTSDQLYPNLVGTLNKCKYVLAKDAPNNNKNESVFETDFIAKHLLNGIYTMNRELNCMLQLKYDGISVVATVKGGKIIEARSRGDVSNNKAVDLTPILYGYEFDNAKTLDPNTEFGIKFEAIMTYLDLRDYNSETGSDYKNCRTAITSIFGRLNGRRYQKYITLVPLDFESENSDEFDFATRIVFLNQFFANTIKNEAIVINGTYVNILYQVNQYLNEAFALRDYAYFMYDGVVFTYLDDDIVDKLGRIGFINQYQVAIKFLATNKITKFLGYSYTIGKDGRITPMINYEPIMFIGTYHTKSSGHSYGRFKELSLAPGDMITVDYTNDVMPYVNKLDCDINRNNPNEPEKFITNCPACGSVIKISPTGKTAYCENINCIGRAIRRLAGFFQALNIKNFNEAYLEKLNAIYLSEIYNMSKAEISRKFNSDIMADKFIIGLKNGLKDRYDYDLIGALGFTSMGSSKWKKILYYISAEDLVKSIDKGTAFELMSSIKGIGGSTAQTVIEEFPLFRKDIEFLLSLPHKKISKDAYRKSVRFSGVRDIDFVNTLNSIGFEASGTLGVTKDTDILVIPYDGYVSSKTEKASKSDNTIIVPIAEFKSNPEKFL